MKRGMSLRTVAEAIAEVVAGVSVKDRPNVLAGCARYLAQHRLLHRADDILDGVDAALLAREGRMRAAVATAEELSAVDAPAIEGMLEGIVGSPVRVRPRRRLRLLAGFRADVAGLRVDASLQGTLARLRARIGRPRS